VIEVLEFIFSSFWRFIGCWLLIATIAEIPYGFIKVIVNKKK
jgi:hypothetical protein